MNAPKYNRALHVRARGIVIAGGGKVMTTKSGIKSRQAILSVLEGYSGDFVNVSALLFGSAAEALDNTEIIAAGPVVDYGTRMETEQGGAKVIRPKLVFAASRECRLAPEPGRTPCGAVKYNPPHNPSPGLYAALSGRVAWLGEPAVDGTVVRQNVGVAVCRLSRPDWRWDVIPDWLEVPRQQALANLLRRRCRQTRPLRRQQTPGDED